MNKEIFSKLLKKANLSKKELSVILGTSYQSVNNWGTNNRDYPYWVKTWLENYIKAKDLEMIIDTVKPYIENK